MKKVLAGFILLNLLLASFGLNAESNVNDSNNQEVKNLTAFAKTYGYVRFFYPNKQTEDFNWDAFLVYGIQKVKSIKTEEELKKVLSDLFYPIAPYVKFTNHRNTALALKQISQGDSISFWQHSSLSIGENTPAKSGGNSIRILVTSIFDSSKVIQRNSPLLKDSVQFEYVDYFNANKYAYPDNYRFEYDQELNNKHILKKQPDPSLPFSSKLTSNMWVTLPIVLTSNEAKHFHRKTKFEEFLKELEDFYSDKDAIFQHDDIWYSDFISAWNTIHHLYPYRKKSESRFGFISSEQIELGLQQISSSKDKKTAALNVVRNYVSLFRDAHANVRRFRTPEVENSNVPNTVFSWLPFYKILLKGKLYVLKSLHPKIKDGDEILEIQNTKTSVLLDAKLNKKVGSPQSNLFDAVNSIGLFTNTSEATIKLKRENKDLTIEVNTISPKEYTKYYKNQFKHKAIEQPNDKIIYINPFLATSENVQKEFDKILESKHLIIDLRSYPNFAPVKDIFKHLPISNGLGKGLILSYPLNMYPAQEYKYHIWQSPLTIPKKPFIDADITVLISSSTESRGETFASYFKHAGATLIGDGNTAGASGGIDWFTTPGKIKIWLTTSYTLRQNGEEMQSIGITPDVLVRHSEQGLKEGKDQIYEAALKRTKEY